MGVVYEAFDRARRTTVALKTLTDAKRQTLHRLQREFRSLAGVVHPNLVTLYELAEHQHTWCLTMELVRGVPFVDYVRYDGDPRTQKTIEMTPPSSTGNLAGISAGPPHGGAFADVLDERRLREAVVQLARGIQAIHRAGKVHRDIKPSNVLVNHDGIVKVLDFGLANEGTPDASDSRAVEGTPAYMAPEQCLDELLTPACDWYAVGTMLYEVLTGTVPFGGSLVHVLAAKQVREPSPPSSLVEGIPADLEELCIGLLRRVPEQRSGGEEILHRLSPRPTRPQRRPPSRLRSFVGRREEIDQVLALCRQPESIHIHFAGPSGFGKTSLARACLRNLKAEGHLVLRSRCFEREKVPYKAIDGIVDALARHLAGLPEAEAASVLGRDVRTLAEIFPTLLQVSALRRFKERRIVDALERRKIAFEALRETLARLSDRNPVVVFVDDVQWSDDDSLDVYRQLLGPGDGPRLKLLTASRDDEKPALVSSLESHMRSTTLRVGPLRADDARALAEALLSEQGDDPRAWAEAIAVQTDGNPLFIEELVRHLFDRDNEQAPLELSAAIRQRLDRLPSGPRRLLSVVAIAGGPLDASLIVGAAELDEDSERALALLRSVRLVRSRKGRGQHASKVDHIDIYHDRVRDTVVDAITPEERQQIHRRLADEMEHYDGPLDFERLADHFEQSGRAARAAEFTLRAAIQAERALAFERAALLYERHRALRDSPTPASILADMGRTLTNAGRSRQAAETYLEAADAGHPDAQNMHRLAAEQFLRSGYVEEGLLMLRRALHAVGLELPRSQRQAILSTVYHRSRVRLGGLDFRRRRQHQLPPRTLQRIDTCWSAISGLAMVDQIRGADFQARHLLFALRAGDPYRIARAMSLEASHLASLGRGHTRRVTELLDRAESLARQENHPHALGLAIGARASVAYLFANWREAYRFGTEAQDVLRTQCRGVGWELATIRRFSLSAMLYLGKLEQLTREARQHVEDALQVDDLYAARSACDANLISAWLVNDDLETARRLVLDLTRPEQGDYVLDDFNALVAQALTLRYQDRAFEAWHLVRREWSALQRSYLMRLELLRASALHCRGAAALQADTPSSLDDAWKCATRLQGERTDYAKARGATVAGLVLQRRGESGAASLLRQSISLFQKQGMDVHAAVIQDYLGEPANSS
ncbi:MAG: protein kinase, partial [Myxococcota bacterium]